MSTLATLTVKLIADASGFKGDMENAGTSVEKLQSKAGVTAAKLAAVGGAMTATITNKVIDVANDLMDVAQKAEDATLKMKSVFGKSAKDIENWATSAATSLGISKHAAITAAGDFGNLFRNMGAAEPDAAALTMNIGKLASDLASFNNVPVDEVFAKLQGGLTGSYEPLRALGINIGDAEIKAKALALGLASDEKELTPLMKAQAAYALIAEQSASATGHFAANSGTLSNQQAILAAKVENVVIALGEKLLPIRLMVVEAIMAMVDWFSNLSPAIQTVILVVVGIVAALGPLLVIAGAVAGAVATLAPVFATIAAILTGPFGLAIAAVIVVISLLYLAWQTNFLGIRESGLAFIAWVQKLFADIVLFVMKHMTEFQNIITSVLNVVRGVFLVFVTIVTGIVNAWTQLLRGDIKGAMETIRLTFATAWLLIQQIFTNAKIFVLNVIALMLDGTRDKAVTALLAIKNIFINSWNDIIEFLRKLPETMTAMGAAMISGLVSGIVNNAARVLTALGDVVQAAIDAIKRRLGIGSPSKLFTGFGVNLMTSLAAGIIQNAALPADALQLATAGLTAPGGAFTSQGGAIGAGVAGAGGAPYQLHFHDVHVRRDQDIDAIAVAVVNRIVRR